MFSHFQLVQTETLLFPVPELSFSFFFKTVSRAHKSLNAGFWHFSVCVQNKQWPSEGGRLRSSKVKKGSLSP